MEKKILDSKLNNIGKKFDYRKKEILFDRFKGWFDNTTFILDNDKFMGWGRYVSDCGTLIIGTACFDGGEWLDTVQHKINTNNPYNNFVNAFAYWELLNDKGKSFWLDYYKNEIILLKYERQSKISDFKSRIVNLKNEIEQIENELTSLTPPRQ